MRGTPVAVDAHPGVRPRRGETRELSVEYGVEQRLRGQEPMVCVGFLKGLGHPRRLPGAACSFEKWPSL